MIVLAHGLWMVRSLVTLLFFGVVASEVYRTYTGGDVGYNFAPFVILISFCFVLFSIFLYQKSDYVPIFLLSFLIWIYSAFVSFDSLKEISIDLAKSLSFLALLWLPSRFNFSNFYQVQFIEKLFFNLSILLLIFGLLNLGFGARFLQAIGMPDSVVFGRGLVGRVSGIYWNPNILSDFLLFFLLFAIHPSVRSYRVIVSCFIVIILSGSKHAMLAMFVIFLLNTRAMKYEHVAFGLAALFVSVVVGMTLTAEQWLDKYYMLNDFLRHSGDRGLNFADNLSLLDNRGRTWVCAIELLTRSGLSGYGFGSWPGLESSVGSEFGCALAFADSHLAEVLVASGLLAPLFYLLLFYPFLQVPKSTRLWARSVIVVIVLVEVFTAGTSETAWVLSFALIYGFQINSRRLNI